MHSGVGCTKLITALPNKRTRALRRHSQRDDGDDNAFADGVLEHYMKRPEEETSPTGQRIVEPSWENMLYPYCHRKYKFVRFKDITQAKKDTGRYWRCIDQPGDNNLGLNADDENNYHPMSLWVIERQDVSPVYYDWRLPNLHGEQYYYQKLLLTVPFRDETPESFITPGQNAVRSLREECTIRGVIPGGNVSATVRNDAAARLFRNDEIEQFTSNWEDFCKVMDFVNSDGDDSADQTGDLTLDQLLKMQSSVAHMHPPPPPEPRVELRDGQSIWHDGGTEIKLKKRQYEAFEALKAAGEKPIKLFLSGEGGMGKSTLIKLLVQWWRSQGLKVIVTASTGKAASLIHGYTCHSAFKLHCGSGELQIPMLEGKQCTPHFQWLATADIIIIDEISMLTASALAGINHALNYVTSSGATRFGKHSFGMKSIIAVGDLYQLPAVENFRTKEQVTESAHWGEFLFHELTETCRVNQDEIDLAEMLSHARLGNEHLTDKDKALLESRRCVNHCPHCLTFTDVQRIKKKGNAAGQSRRSQKNNDQDDADEIVQEVHHCPLNATDIITAALVAKVDELNERALNEALNTSATTNDAVYTVHATDIHNNKSKITGEPYRAIIDKRRSGLKRVLKLYEGMEAILVINKDTERQFVNGVVGKIIKIVIDEVKAPRVMNDEEWDGTWMHACAYARAWEDWFGEGGRLLCE